MSGAFIDVGKSGASRIQQDPQWRALLESAGEGIWGVDFLGDCTFVNRMASEILGFRSEELVGSNMHALVHHHRSDGSDYPPSECPIYNVFHHNEPVRQMKDTMFRKDGTAFLAEMSAQPVMVDQTVVGVVVTFRDVSELYRQQEELRRAHEVLEQRTAELDAVIESIPHGVFIAALDGKVRLNLRAREMTGEKFPTNLHTLSRALGGESSTETVCSSPHSASETFSRAESKMWIRSVAAPIVVNGRLQGGVAVNTDITQNRLQEEALRKAEKLAAVGQLASSIAHEINNPLESITNLLYLLRHATSMEEVQEYAQTAQTELSRVSEITLQTLRFHRQQSKPGYIDMAEMLNTILSLYTGRFIVRVVTLATKISDAPKVFCLEGEIRQVLNNLIRNAVDAMPEGGRLVVSLRPGCDPHNRDGVRITIADSGEGISPQIVDRLFEPFQTTKELTGTGLGLWVSKGIVDKDGGTICVKTRRTAPSGTIFAVWLPLNGEGFLKAGKESDSDRAEGPADLTRMN